MNSEVRIHSQKVSSLNTKDVRRRLMRQTETERETERASERERQSIVRECEYEQKLY